MLPSYLPTIGHKGRDLIVRQKLLRNFILITATFAVFYVLVSYVIGFKEGMIIMSSHTIFQLINFFMYTRKRYGYRFASNFYITNCFFNAVLTCAYFSGGISSPVANWFVLIPVISLLLLGNCLDTRIWLLVSFSFGFLLLLADIGGYKLPVGYEKAYTSFFNASCVMGLVIIVYWFSSVFEFERNNYQKLVEEKNVHLEAQQDELLSLNDNLVTQKRLVETTYERLKSTKSELDKSILYASQVQTSTLPKRADFLDFFSDCFIIYRPKHVVSGDFYWFSQLSNTQAIFVLADCTGHGVPGAFMSMLGCTILHETINVRKMYDPADILAHLHRAVFNMLKQATTNNNDGMDIAVTFFEKYETEVKMIHASAKALTYYVAEDEIVELRGGRQLLGGGGLEATFENQEFLLPIQTLFYFNSDGYQDQNNAERKKIGRNAFKSLLLDNSRYTFAEQQHHFEQFLQKHQGQCDQRDDIALVGLRFV